ncbi:DUF805 domain-containing protein [Pleionea sp. CnH1-48]|uniref:DUF805 domain-containing protein n=1 Tax=Pleionea sp. CnH1-48 TaxID=2954494 RepID=UPI002096CECC|nr:DUF805 domain-containing protein [Pleionea sp. CnH1-48]MCO7223556.1 DUF805 domain-containing protein [Pleionea sp. CnH1-48]
MFKFFYLNVKGRCSRKIYWLVGVLPFVILGFLAYFLNKALNLGEVAFLIINLLVLWPILAMQVKRLHDINVTGWFCLLTFIPYIGLLFSVVIGLVPSSKAENKYD